MFDLNEINESYLANLKYSNFSEYFGSSMAHIFCSLIAKNMKIVGADFYSVCRQFSHRFLGAYLELRFPDYSIAVYKIGVGNGALLSKAFDADIGFFDSLFE